jgi:hypothetical protein
MCRPSSFSIKDSLMCLHTSMVSGKNWSLLITSQNHSKDRINKFIFNYMY